MEKLEKDIERKLVDLVKSYGGLCLKWVCPGWAGVPDRIVLLPGAIIYFVETKKPKGGVLSALQKKWRGWLQGLGFSYYLIHNEEQLAIFKELLTWKMRG